MTVLGCMYVCLMVALCDCVNGKGQYQLSQGERFFKEVPFFRPRKQIWLATNHWLSYSQLCSRALRLVWETMKRYPRTNPGPFTIGPFGHRTGNPHFTSRGNHQILTQKDPLQAVGLPLWLGARRHWCKCHICPATIHQPPNYPPKLDCHTLALEGTLRPSMAPTHLHTF